MLVMSSQMENGILSEGDIMVMLMMRQRKVVSSRSCLWPVVGLDLVQYLSPSHIRPDFLQKEQSNSSSIDYS